MKVEVKDIDFFPAQLVKIGGSLGIIFPKNNIKYSGLEEGDRIKIYYKKIK